MCEVCNGDGGWPTHDRQTGQPTRRTCPECGGSGTAPAGGR